MTRPRKLPKVTTLQRHPQKFKKREMQMFTYAAVLFAVEILIVIAIRLLFGTSLVEAMLVVALSMIAFIAGAVAHLVVHVERMGEQQRLVPAG